MATTDHDTPQPEFPARSVEGPILTASALAWLGAAISFLLLQHHTGAPSLFCPARAGCEAVLSSKYATVMGVPLPWLGITFYLTLLALLLTAYGMTAGKLRAVLLGGVVWLSVAGVSFSTVLMFIQFRVLHAFCPLCTASAAVMAGLVWAAAKTEELATASQFAGRRGAALALGSFALISASMQLASVMAVEPDAVAIVDAQVFTRTQMETELGAPLQSLQRSAYSLEFEWVRKQVDGALLAAEAKNRRTTVTDLLAVHAADRDTFLEQIAKGHRIEIRLKVPKVRSLRIDLTAAQISGPRDAPVQLVVFSDFQCAFCAKLAPVLQRIGKEFPKDVMVAFRHFPLEAHNRAIAAAIAAECAAEQGAFWAYHDKLFNEGGELSDSRLLDIASTLGLERKRFIECQGSGRVRQIVEASRKDAADSGLEGAPALFLNGRLIGGMVDYNALAFAVKNELRAAGQVAPAR